VTSMYVKSMMTAMFMMSLMSKMPVKFTMCVMLEMSVDFLGVCKVHDICDVHDVSEIHDVCDVHDISLEFSVLYCKDIFVRDSDMRFSKSGIFISRPHQGTLINFLSYFLIQFSFLRGYVTLKVLPRSMIPFRMGFHGV
jgi:hypothetical protein